MVKNKTSDIDIPLVAGKSTLVRIGLDVKTASGVSTFASSVDMKIYR